MNRVIMNRIAILSLSLFVAISGPALAQNSPDNSTPPAGNSEAPTGNADQSPADKDAADKMLASLKAEGEAMASLAGKIKTDVKAGKVKLADGAEKRWDTGAAMWDEVKALGEAGKQRAAYEKMRELRHLFGDTLGMAFSGKVSKPVRDGFLAWWKVADTRIDHIVEYGKNHDLSDEVKGHYSAGKTHWEAAKAAAASKKYRDAFVKMLQGLDELDHVMWSTWKGN